MPLPARVQIVKAGPRDGSRLKVMEAMKNFGKRSSAALRIALLFTLGLTVTGAAHAGDVDGVYVGTLGKSSIVAVFYKIDHDKPVGNYFYRTQGRDIGLVAQNQEGQYMECPVEGTSKNPEDYAPLTPEPCDKPFGYWRLSMTGDNAVGAWSKTPDFTTTLVIQLQRVPKQGDCTDYECLRAEGPVSVVKNSQKQSDDGAVAWHFLREERSGASIPQLTKAPDEAALRAINESLRKAFRDDISWTLASPSNGYRYKVPFANKQMMVVDRDGCTKLAGGSVACYWRSATYDLASGEEIYWAKLMPFPTKIPFNYKKGKDFLSLALRTADETADDCFIFEDDLDCKGSVCSRDLDWYGQFSPRKNGLFVAFPFNRGPENYACVGKGFIIPWRKIRPLLLKPFPLP